MSQVKYVCAMAKVFTKAQGEVFREFGTCPLASPRAQRGIKEFGAFTEYSGSMFFEGVNAALEVKKFKDALDTELTLVEHVAVITAAEMIVSAAGVAITTALVANPGGIVLLCVSAGVYLFIAATEEELLQGYMDARLKIFEWINNFEWNAPCLEPCDQIGREYIESMKKASTAERIDPLILDLNGDGAKAIGLSAGVRFDQDGDGFAEGTGWACPKDGLLVLDRNGDGKINDGSELFGDETMLRSGQKASNGFEALAEFDDNNDGKIAAHDTIYSQLKVWQDANADGISTAEELHSLNELGIAGISLDSTATNFTDSHGNSQTRLGTFERTDGSTGEIGGFRFQRNPMDTTPTEWIAVPADIAALPDLVASGIVHNLHQAMVRDTSGQLKTLVEQFGSAPDTAARNSLMQQVLFK